MPPMSPQTRRPVFNLPLIRRLAWYGRRIKQQLNPSLVWRLLVVLLVIVAITALIEMLAERPLSLDSYAASFYWAFTSLLGNGDSGFAQGPTGGILYSALIVVGVLILGLVTGAIIAVIIDFLLKEGQGLGASGFRNHIVICGWNPTAREAIEELRSDDYKRRLVLIHDSERNPAEGAVYYVRGDPTNTEDLERADISDAEAALVFPASPSNEADMRSILTVMAIESVAPHVRTVVEANNPRHVEHFRRAHADEVLVTPRLASHLLARAALYPGLSELVTDMVSGGVGSELYRIQMPDDHVGLGVDESSRKLRDENHATLLAISRGGETFVNPDSAFVIAEGDEALVVAEKLGKLSPVRAAEAKRAALAAAAAAEAAVTTADDASSGG
jgi:voltage-gated potassium channel